MRSRYKRRTASQGFTLWELMVVVFIIAILASLSYPSYREHMLRSRRTDAIGGLVALHLAQERWRAQHPSYASLAELRGADAIDSAEGYYRLEITEQGAGHFVAIARPRPRGPQHNDPCGVFALDQRGPLHTDSYADASCWLP